MRCCYLPTKCQSQGFLWPNHNPCWNREARWPAHIQPRVGAACATTRSRGNLFQCFHFIPFLKKLFHFSSVVLVSLANLAEDGLVPWQGCHCTSVFGDRLAFLENWALHLFQHKLSLTAVNFIRYRKKN